MSDTARLLRHAADLHEAARTRLPIPALTERDPDLTLTEAYAIQQALVSRWMAAGARLVGHKVGLTSTAIQEQLGVTEPDAGVLLDTMIHPDGAVLDVGRLIAPRLEAELALILGADLAGPVGEEEVLAAVASVAVALEVIDSRIADWRIRIVDTVADNASSAEVVLGDPVPLAEARDLAQVGITTWRNGSPVASGAGAAVLGHPARALVWLARQLSQRGENLCAGDVVLPGAVHAALPVAGGDTVTATAGALGSVTVRFSGKAQS
ncbi:2-keto-4-pentenoate hydratase [Kocuria rosea]|uniref:2-keto-4-pentenoate hydratase n=1 Tax=Kocuria rosea TaxID=1275 RepID=A0A4R5YAX1_KOCRO|nr:fumarylacetoacetate hydrolase family protein [Kocuria rosea]TDL41873.1 2-keto-4-pentenoate hydratase [Kocuria rosea]